MGYPDEKKLKEYMRNHYKNSTWQLNVIDDIVDTCMAEVATKVLLAKETTPANTQKCSPSASIFTHCMWRQFVSKCPAEFQDQSQHCQRMREKVNRKDTNEIKSVETAKPVQNSVRTT